MTYDAIVVGGGIVGLSSAYHLVCARARTLLLDRGDAGRATDAGAGIVVADTNLRDPDAWQVLARAAQADYPELIAQLEEEQSGATGYAERGLLLVAVDAAEQALFERARARILERSGAGGEVTEIPAAEARARFPLLGEVRGALFARRAARVDGRLLSAALRRSAVARGLIVEEVSAEALELEGRAVTGVVAEGECYSAGAVALAGGAWSRAFESQLELAIAVEPQRGQIAHLGLGPLGIAEAATDAWPMIAGLRDHYMVAWPDARIAVGATRETGSGFAAQTTAQGVREVLDQALRVAPRLAEAEVREIRVGLRPLSADGLPLIGPVRQRRNVFVATGHGPTGLTLGPYTGRLVADLVLGRKPPVDLSAFDPARFRDRR